MSSGALVQDLGLLRLNVTWADGSTSATTPLIWVVKLAEGPQGQVQVGGTLRIQGAWGRMNAESAALLSEEAADEHHRSSHFDGGAFAACMETMLSPILWAYTRQTALPVIAALPTGPAEHFPREPPAP
ncbi:hypothetical protein GCM10009762_13510 [Dermacoccus barathri]|uniref:Uncharacterized protein n=1 Tax=Dermacoccus barathri TaxID=322601 RepID=A0ABN2BJ14_9MICO